MSEESDVELDMEGVVEVNYEKKFTNFWFLGCAHL